MQIFRRHSPSEKSTLIFTFRAPTLISHFILMTCNLYTSFAGSYQHGLLLSDTGGQAYSEDCVREAPSQRTTGETNCLRLLCTQDSPVNLVLMGCLLV